MQCAKCNYDSIPEGASFCPSCGEKIAEPSKPSTQITVTQEVGNVEGGKITGVQVGQVTGDLTVDSTVNQIENKMIQGDYVDRKVMLNL